MCGLLVRSESSFKAPSCEAVLVIPVVPIFSAKLVTQEIHTQAPSAACFLQLGLQNVGLFGDEFAVQSPVVFPGQHRE